MNKMNQKHESHMLIYAVDSNGFLVNVDDVRTGNECGCFCPACKEPLMAKNQGQKRIHHFAHQSGTECDFAYESMLHLLAKEKVRNAFLNNWTYSGLVPCSPWRSAFTLPRELHTVRRSGRILLASTPVTELDAIAEDWVEWPMRGDTLAVVGRPAAFEAEITIPTDADNTLTFRNQEGEFVRLMYLKSSKSLDRLFWNSRPIPSLNLSSRNLTLYAIMSQFHC